MTTRNLGEALVTPHSLVALGEVYGKTRQHAEGFHLLDEALTLINETGMRFAEAELHRVRGELLFSLSMDNHTEAETCFHQAIVIAQNQHAKSCELRAATSLARLWQQQGKRAEARQLLSEI
jgi:predicted ATPase